MKFKVSKDTVVTVDELMNVMMLFLASRRLRVIALNEQSLIQEVTDIVGLMPYIKQFTVKEDADV